MLDPRIYRAALLPVVLALIVVAMGVSLALRTPFKVDIVRDRGALARIAEGGNIENVFRIQIMNATEAEQHYRITADGLPGILVALAFLLALGSAWWREGR